MLGVGIVGAGRMGAKRAAHLQGARLVAVTDLSLERAQALASAHGGAVSTTLEALLGRSDVHLVIVATPNGETASCATAALARGKHVLIEKPGGRTPADILRQATAAAKSGRILRVGFNHRFHPAFQKASQLIRAGAIGPIMYIRACYGHGGRLGYEKEWRADPALAGGGELLDQGVHLIDLCRWLAGEFELVFGDVRTAFWDMPVEDNGFLYLRSPDGARVAWLHASSTEWKNLFDFEIFGRTGKVQISGLGRSYGPEELRLWRMQPQMGPPQTEVFKFSEDDRSWHLEFDAFVQATEGNAQPDLASIEDALCALKIVHEAYARAGAFWAQPTGDTTSTV